MWIKIEYIDTDEKTLIFPKKLFRKLKKSASLAFGNRTAEVRILRDSTLFYTKKPSFENPVAIFLSKDLESHLLIPDTQTYRAKVKGNTLSLGPVIGLLLGIYFQDYDPNHMEKYSDRMGVYDKVGGLIYAFSSDSVNWDEGNAHGLYFNVKTSKWEYGDFPLPSVIYRRDFHQAQSVIDRLKEATGGNLFNSYRFSKLELFDILEQDEMLSQRLPTTEKIKSFRQLKDFADKHKKIILKPDNLSRGRGICIIEKKGKDYIVKDYRGREPLETVLKGEFDFLAFYYMNASIQDDYLVQKHLSLAKINGSVFDIRVVMQKKSMDDWVLGGIECRASNPNSLITNISRGGYALGLDEALDAAFSDEEATLSLTEQIQEYCQDLCAYLDGIGEHFGEFGIDIGVDDEQNLWLIEANVFPSFKGFKRMDYETYLNIRYTPLLYALSLTEFADLHIVK